tara:strand:+ start:1561 stop:2148 length:588 start_codon:yes stop_codon:yes gene_type:complete
MKRSLFTILLGAVIGAFIVLQFRGCGRIEPVIETTIETVHHTDTIRTHSTDTLLVEGPTKYIYRDAPSEEGTEDGETFFVHEYEEEYLNATVKTYSGGSQYLDYNVICPEITHTDSVIVTNTDTIKITNTVLENKVRLYTVGSGMFNDSGLGGVGFGAGIKFKNDYLLRYQYNVQFEQDNQHEVSFMIPLKRRKN